MSAVSGCTSPVTAMGLKDALTSGGVAVSDTVPTALELVGLVGSRRPDLCLIVTPFGDVPEVVALLAESSRSTRIVVIASGDAAPSTVLSTLRAGADGWLPLTTPADRLVAALRAVVRGEAAVPRALMSTVLAELRSSVSRAVPRADGTICQLPPREHDVLLGLAAGLTTTAVAEQLGIGEATVRGYIASAVRRLGAADRAAAVGLVGALRG